MKRSMILIVGAALLFAMPAEARDMKGSGTAAYVPVASDTSELPSGKLLRRVHSKTIILADDDTLPFHLARQDCSGTYVLTPEGEIEIGRGHCEAVDQDGDVWWLWWESVSESGKWGILGGTGKYDGMAGSGTTTPIAAHDDGRFAVKWEGSWVMK